MATTLRIDLSSDTSTQPSEGMRKAMYNAEVGDEQKGEDKTTTSLCDHVASLLGKEAAVFLPSGIMSNVVSLLTHCAPGDDVICSSDAHIIGSEGGGLAIFGGISITPIDTTRGIYSADELKSRLRPTRSRSPHSRLAHIEQTTNKGGGAIWSIDQINDVAEVAKDAGLSVHMDGARLMNAVVASGVFAADFVAECDSAWIDFSKGLGAPVGSVLTGSKDFIEEAWAWKHRLGGAMRQSGVIAAAGLYALEHNVERLAEDHANAQMLAERIAQIPGIKLDPPEVETNLVFFDVSGTGLSAPEIASKLLDMGVRIGATNDRRMRAVTHLDVSTSDVIEAADGLQKVFADHKN